MNHYITSHYNTIELMEDENSSKLFVWLRKNDTVATYEDVKLLVDKLSETLNKFSVEDINNVVKADKDYQHQKYEEDKKLVSEYQLVNSYNKPQHVYLMKDDRNRFKIGITNNVDRRLYDLRLFNPKLIAKSILTTDARNIEKTLHEKYAQYRIPRSEWFEFDSLDKVKEIESALREVK